MTENKKETPNKTLLRLAREIIQLWDAQGKDDFSSEDVACELYKTVRQIADTKDRSAMLFQLIYEGAYQYANDELDEWRDGQTQIIPDLEQRLASLNQKEGGEEK